MDTYILESPPKANGEIVRPLIVRGSNLPIQGDYTVGVNGISFPIRATFEENPIGFKQPVYGFFSHRDHPATLITGRLMRTKTTKDHILLNDMDQKGERNFGYLTFNPRPADEREVHISDFCLGGALSNSLDNHGEAFSCDELKGLVIELFADIARSVYNKSRVKNMYPYPEEVDFYLACGFELVDGQAPFLVRLL